MRYNVFKDYGYVTEVLIGQFDDLEIAQARAEQEAEISFADEVIEVATFGENGEYITHFKSMGAAFAIDDSKDAERDEDDSWYWDYNSPASYHHY